MIKKPYLAYRSFWKEPETRKKFAAAGFKQFCVFPANTANSVGEPYCQYPPVWKWFDKYDFNPFDQQMEDNLSLCPDAEILLMIDLNSPPWLARQLSMDSFSSLGNTISIPRWKDATEHYLDAMLKHAVERYGKQIKCCILACGQTDEWMDYSRALETAPRLSAYQDWCRNHGYSVPESIPDYARRFHFASDGLRDENNDAEAVRYWQFHSDHIAENILHFAEFTRKRIPDAWEIGVFFGYILELTQHRLVQGGHLSYERVLSSRTIDFVISPGSYLSREMGGGGGFMAPNATVHRYEKNCFHEVDHLTHTGNMKMTPYVRLEWMQKWPDTACDIAGLRREFCRTLTHGASQWYFDMWGHFYDDPAVMNEIAKERCIWEKYADRSRNCEAEIVLIVDPQSTLLVDDRSGSRCELYRIAMSLVNRIGAPSKFASLNDIPYIPPCKLAIPIGLARTYPEIKELIAQLQHKAARVVAVESPRCAEFLVEQISQSELSMERLRLEAEKAGVRLYGECGDVVYRASEFFALHTASGGERSIAFPEKYTMAEDLFSGEIIPIDGGFLKCSFAAPDTRLFRLK